MLLSEYVTQTREILHDERGNYYSTAKIQRWVNRARNQCAADNECVRYMPASIASVATAVPSAGGAGYTTITLTVSPPDAVGGTYTRAVLTGNLVAGVLTSVNIVNAGSGYIQVPTVTVAGNGAGAAVAVTLTPHLTTAAGRELYTFQEAATILGNVPGLRGIIGIQGISVSWGSLRPTLSHISFSDMQAYLRAQSIGQMNFPSIWAQYGQGEHGSLYLWPRPAQVAQMEWDCYCSVTDLVDDTSVDLIPYPWDEACPFYAAHLAFLFSQRFDDARLMLAEFTRRGMLARSNTSPTIRPSMYE